ncbi:glycosyltransferase [Haloarcula sp. Atlit-47R]|nr:glycosyltransferase [Haloarcula sp. Atlit-47R]
MKDNNVIDEVVVFLPALEIGGVERMTLNLAEEFLNRGIDVTIVLARDAGELMNEVPESISLKILDAPDPTRFSLLSAVPSLSKYLFHKEPDVLLSFMKHANITSLLAQKMSMIDTTVIIGERNHLSKALENEPWRREIAFQNLMKMLYPSADHIIATSVGVAEDIESYLNKPLPVSTVYNPVVTPELKKKSKEDPDHEWFDDPDVPVVLSAARLHPQKDFQTLIKAFSLVDDRFDARLLILGEGKERDDLESLIQDLDLESKTDLPGVVENPFPYMANSSVFVLSSVWEGFGNVLVEAMACGCPIVSTDCPSGPSEILDGGTYGELVPVGSPELLSDAIEESLSNPIDETKIRARADNFSVDSIADEYLNIISSVKNSQ